MKQKLLNLLKPKFANKGFSQKTIEGLADYLIAQNLTEESTDDEVNTAIAGVEPIANLMQAENTRYANEVKAKLTKPVEEAPKPETAPEAINDTPEWAKSLMEEVKALKAEKTQTSIKSKFLEAVGKDVPQSILDLISIPDSEDQVEAVAEKVKANWVASQQASTNNGLGGDKPAGAQGKPVGGAKASDKELDAVMTSLKI